MNHLLKSYGSTCILFIVLLQIFQIKKGLQDGSLLVQNINSNTDVVTAARTTNVVTGANANDVNHVNDVNDASMSKSTSTTVVNRDRNALIDSKEDGNHPMEAVIDTTKEPLGDGNEKNEIKIIVEMNMNAQTQHDDKDDNQADKYAKKNEIASVVDKAGIEDTPSEGSSDNDNDNNPVVIDKEQETVEEQPGLDFFIAGYPKTGTSSLMDYFHASDEMEIIKKSDEEAEFIMLSDDDMDLLFNRIQEEKNKQSIINSNGNENRKKVQKYGIKWPNAVSIHKRGIGVRSIELLQKYNPQGTSTKILIGLRHPVDWFESYYNYRIGSNFITNPPPTASLIGSHEWKGVSTDAARFEEGILQLGKLPLRPEDEEFIGGHGDMGMINGGTPYKVFVYLQEQLGDSNIERKGVFLEELSSFMEVKKPFTVSDEVPISNKNSDKQHDMCKEEHDAVRKVLVENGRKTAEWIRANLVNAVGFTLANEDHFLSVVDTFGIDPCDEESIL